MRKWREIHSLDFLIFSLFPPSLSISYIKIVIFCRKMSKTDFCHECHKKLNMRNEKMILGRIRCEKAPQVVPAWCALDSTAGSIFVVILVELTIQPISLQILRRPCCLVWTAKKVY